MKKEIILNFKEDDWAELHLLSLFQSRFIYEEDEDISDYEGGKIVMENGNIIFRFHCEKKFKQWNPYQPERLNEMAPKGDAIV